MYFEDLPLSEDVLDALYDIKFEVCSPVQELCIPHILEKKDLVGIAQTGTGKTAAYLLPIITLIQQENRIDNTVKCIIMAPTRELVQQIDNALQGFAYYVNLSSIAIYGGNDGIRYEQEKKSLQKGADIIIATPGRLITHLKLNTFNLNHVSHFVLDEADRMLDMGFADDIQTVIKYLPKKRQTLLFSATMPTKIRQLARNLMHKPVEVNIAISKPAETIKQSVVMCSEQEKLNTLIHILDLRSKDRGIIFASSKSKVKEIHKILTQKGYNIAAMHSDLEQKDRNKTMLDYKAKAYDFMVATDIVARGIDIEDIKLIINLDTPNDPEDYIHRIGRVGRAGKEGEAITFVSHKEREKLNNIEQLLSAKIERLVLNKSNDNIVLSNEDGSKAKSKKRSHHRYKPNKSKSQKPIKD